MCIRDRYWYNATGDTRLLFAATRFTEFLIDYINGRDGFQGYKVVPPHELPEEALQTLYAVSYTHLFFIPICAVAAWHGD